MNCHCLLSTYMYTSKKSQAYYSVGIRTHDCCKSRAVSYQLDHWDCPVARGILNRKCSSGYCKQFIDVTLATGIKNINLFFYPYTPIIVSTLYSELTRVLRRKNIKGVKKTITRVGFKEIFFTSHRGFEDNTKKNNTNACKAVWWSTNSYNIKQIGKWTST